MPGTTTEEEWWGPAVRQQPQAHEGGQCEQTSPTRSDQGTPSPLKKARKQARQQQQREEAETAAASEQAGDQDPRGAPAEAGGAAADNATSGAAHHLAEAANLASQLQLPDVERALREARDMLPGGRTLPQPPPPSPNAFQVAALVVGLMADRTALGGSPPDRGELLEVQDLVRAGGRLLLGGRRSTDWTRTHHATDAAEGAAEMLEEILQQGGLGKYPEDQLGTLQNLLAAAADGVHVLVGAYPHAGEAEGVSSMAPHPADVIALEAGGNESLPWRPTAGGPQAIHAGQAQAATTAALYDGGHASDGECRCYAPAPVDYRALGGRSRVGGRLGARPAGDDRGGSQTIAFHYHRRWGARGGQY